MIYGLNPMVEVIDGFRWCLLGTNTGYFVGALRSDCYHYSSVRRILLSAYGEDLCRRDIIMA